MTLHFLFIKKQSSFKVHSIKTDGCCRRVSNPLTICGRSTPHIRHTTIQEQ